MDQSDTEHQPPSSATLRIDRPETIVGMGIPAASRRRPSASSSRFTIP